MALVEAERRGIEAAMNCVRIMAGTERALADCATFQPLKAKLLHKAEALELTAAALSDLAKAIGPNGERV